MAPRYQRTVDAPTRPTCRRAVTLADDREAAPSAHHARAGARERAARPVDRHDAHVDQQVVHGLAAPDQPRVGERGVVGDDHVVLGREVHVELERRDAEREGTTEGLERVLGPEAGAAAVGLQVERRHA